MTRRYLLSRSGDEWEFSRRLILVCRAADLRDRRLSRVSGRPGLIARLLDLLGWRRPIAGRADPDR